MIDLRSDTVTLPSEEMRRYMMYAPVGDDVYGEDPSINLLQEKVAEMFSKESALYVPSGTMSNQLSLKVLTESADEIIIESDAHVFYYETAAPSVLSAVQLRTIPSEFGEMPIDDIKKTLRPDIYYYPRTRAVFLENTHNRHGGRIISIEYIRELREFCNQKGITMHLDGARIWNAHVATGVSLDEYGKYFETISVCLSKGLGAPVGSLMLSTNENIEKAKKWRKILGGGMRQAGILAAAGIFAIDNNLRLIENDHINAMKFAKSLAEMEYIDCNPENIETNIVIFALDERIKDEDFVGECNKRGLLLSGVGDNKIRVVFHLQINEQATYEAVDIIYDAANYLIKDN